MGRTPTLDEKCSAIKIDSRRLPFYQVNDDEMNRVKATAQRFTLSSQAIATAAIEHFGSLVMPKIENAAGGCVENRKRANGNGKSDEDGNDDNGRGKGTKRRRIEEDHK